MKKFFGITLLLISILFVSCGAPRTADDLINTPGARDNSQYMEFRGEGIVDTTRFPNPAQAKLAAKEAALVDAQSKAIETIFGLKIEGGKTVQDFVLQNKNIDAQFQGYIRGLKEIGSGITEDGVAWVILRISKKDVEKILGVKLND
ncbi:hypothetical protein OSSY52_09480 [Tepiditoga spiralis]|uniref:Lipoprotein n=1 Tax=Tepiditoga spiralis TaxID=2108365 RepID=A0A7G1G7A5_9BACT|nr:hypothetical protein [Tepiditoga spiralis]BBE30807.1 hypothetical protein OSSY52_09480 [Tepiditoga spiralis]